LGGAKVIEDVKHTSAIIAVGGLQRSRRKGFFGGQKMKVLKTATILCVAVILGGLPTLATAAPVIETFGFYNIANNDPADAAIGEAQLFVDVSDEFADHVLFTFRNTGPEACAISEVYFDDGTLLGMADIIDNPPDVVFVQGASPPELPGANSIDPPFETTLDFLAESVPPPAHKGVNPGEQVGILFDLQPAKTYQNVIDELYDGGLRIGLHAIGFDSGGSESFVSVPEPATIALLGLGALASLCTRR
jgi:hypothetical protein